MMWYERPLPMSVGDMVHEYRQAKDPIKQIDIIADQCDTYSTRIAWLLNRAGCIVDYKRLPRARRKEDSIDFVALWENSEEAKQADQIRERTIKEKQEMYKYNETDTACQVAEQYPVTEGIESKEYAEEMALPEEKSVTESVTEAQADEEETAESPLAAGLSDVIAAELWDVYLRYKPKETITPWDVRAMRLMADIAERLTEQ